MDRGNRWPIKPSDLWIVALESFEPLSKIGREALKVVCSEEEKQHHLISLLFREQKERERRMAGSGEQNMHYSCHREDELVIEKGHFALI